MLDTVQQAFDKFWKSVSAILIKLHFLKFYQGWIVTKASLRNDGKIMRTKVTDQGLCIIQLIIKHSPELHFQSMYVCMTWVWENFYAKINKTLH